MLHIDSIMRLDKQEILARARKHYFSLGINDGAASLCRENYAYGLAKLHYSQEMLGLAPNATFMSTPDETISRNKGRWVKGYGYGGKLVWSDKPENIIFIDTKPNACGMLVGGLDELPSWENILKNIDKLLIEDYYIDDIKIKWDFKNGNHFIDVFEIEPLYEDLEELPKYAFIIHGSAPELKGETNMGFGLYWDKSEVLKDMCGYIETPFGKTAYLEGDAAKEYYDFFIKAKKFANSKRIMAAKLLFGDFSVLSNVMHQGLRKMNELLLGAQYINNSENKFYPLALKSDLPAYLMAGKHCLTDEVIEALGFEKRARKIGVYNRLKNFNTLPHGGGYALPHISKVIEVKEIENKRYFICEQENEEALTILTDVTETQFFYRGKSVAHKIEELNLGRREFKLIPKFILKI